MREYWGLDHIPADWPSSVLTIGNFDGVHRGHQAILARSIETANATGSQAVALIFDPHPTKVVRPEKAPALLSLPEERLRRFKKLGVTAGVVMRFTPEIAAMGPREFIADVVVKRLRARAVVVGENFRFGCRQAGDFAALRSLGQEFDFVASRSPSLSKSSVSSPLPWPVSVIPDAVETSVKVPFPLFFQRREGSV